LLDHTRWTWSRYYIPYTQPKEDDELNLLWCLHLQLQHNWNGKSKQDALGDHLIHNRQSQNDDPVDAFCIRPLFEIPYSAEGKALEGGQSKEGKRKASRENHEEVASPLQPNIGEDAEIQAKDAVLDQKQLEAPEDGSDVRCFTRQLSSVIGCEWVKWHTPFLDRHDVWIGQVPDMTADSSFDVEEQQDGHGDDQDLAQS
jgi:hypothetical protein